MTIDLDETKDTLPEGFKPLDPDLDYVDVTDFERKMLLVKMSEMQRLQEVMARSILQLQKSMVEVRQKQIELEADMAAADIGSANGKKSALILPDRLHKN